jgi:hypothetical protein
LHKKINKNKGRGKKDMRALGNIWHSPLKMLTNPGVKKNDFSSKQQFLPKQCKPGWQLPLSYVLCLPQVIK